MLSLGMTSENRCETRASAKFLSAPRSPWQRAYVERVIGSIRRECLDHVIVFHETRYDDPQFVFRLLSPIKNTSFVGEGLAGATNDSAAGNGVRRGGGRRPADWHHRYERRAA